MESNSNEIICSRSRIEQLSVTNKKELGMLEYPGLVKEKKNMLDTLGGIFKVSQAVCGESKRLELRYHPENPFNKAISGEITHKMGLLISIRKYKLANTNHTKNYRFEIIGYTKNCIVFECLCDFQYLPINSNSTLSTSESLLDTLIPKGVNDTSLFIYSSRHFFCTPYFFARSDSFKGNIFRNTILEEGHSEILGPVKKSSYNNRDVLVFNMIDSIPMRPDKQVVKKMKIKYVSDEQLEKVKKLFDDCPIWTRIALLHESGISNDKLKCIIPSLAFYYSTGPWRTMYVRFGYDPRKDFYSRFYQTFDFRLRFRSGISELVENCTVTKGEDSSLFQDIGYPYLDENKLPRSRQCILRYCDIRLHKIQAMLDKIPTPITGARCNDRTGWLPLGFDAQIRQILSNVIKDALRKHCKK